MKPFKFSLDRMRNFKQQLLSIEKNKLSELNAQRDSIEGQISTVERFRVDKNREMHEKQRVGMNSSELSSYRFLLDNTVHQLEGLRKELAEAIVAAEHQRIVVLEASREISSLDKLEEKQREEHALEQKKQDEAEVLEQVSMRYNY